MLFDLQIFSGGVFPPSATSRTLQSPFLFPIVFGINYNSNRSRTESLDRLLLKEARKRFLLGNAEAFPILCVRCAR